MGKEDRDRNSPLHYLMITHVHKFAVGLNKNLRADDVVILQPPKVRINVIEEDEEDGFLKCRPTINGTGINEDQADQYASFIEKIRPPDSIGARLSCLIVLKKGPPDDDSGLLEGGSTLYENKIYELWVKAIQ